jgi:hypothetical protein
MKAKHMILAIWMGFFAGPLLAQDQSWEPVTGAEQLRKIFSNTVFENTLKGKNKATSRFNADGTGETSAWGETFTREWKIEGEDQVCVLIDRAGYSDGGGGALAKRSVSAGFSRRMAFQDWLTGLRLRFTL